MKTSEENLSVDVKVDTGNTVVLVVVLLSQMKEAGFRHPLCGIGDNNVKLPKLALLSKNCSWNAFRKLLISQTCILACVLVHV